MIDSLKNDILNAWKAKQDSVDADNGVLDLIGAYGPEGWLNSDAGFKSISWETATNGTMKMAEEDIIIEIANAGTLYGFRIISSDAVGGATSIGINYGIDIKVDVRTVTTDDIIRVTDTTLGIDS